jgi:galactitol-specific phosphotransferase system IIB component
MLLKSILRNHLAILMVSAVILTSCQGNKSGNTNQSATDSLNKEEITKTVKDVVYPLPSPYELSQMLNGIGAKFNASSLNPSDKADKYFTEKNKAVNLGVYGADLGYCAIYDKKQETQIYMQSVKTLIDDLGITVDYSRMLSDEFKEKVNNKDTLVKVITNTIFDTYGFLNEKSNPDLAVMMVSGMWVESMYIATHISKDTYNNPEIVKIIASQKEALNKLLEHLASRNSNADIKDLESKLQTLRPIYEKVDQGLKAEDYKTILKTIEMVRKSFVS